MPHEGQSFFLPQADPELKFRFKVTKRSFIIMEVIFLVCSRSDSILQLQINRSIHQVGVLKQSSAKSTIYSLLSELHLEYTVKHSMMSSICMISMIAAHPSF